MNPIVIEKLETKLNDFVANYARLWYHSHYEPEVDTVWFEFTDASSEPNWHYKHGVSGDRLSFTASADALADEIITGYLRESGKRFKTDDFDLHANSVNAHQGSFANPLIASSPDGVAGLTRECIYHLQAEICILRHQVEQLKELVGNGEATTDKH